MRIQPRQLIAFLERPPAETRAVLIYGPDNGQVRETAARLTRSVVDDPGDPFRVAELNAAELRADPARLLDEAGALSFAGGRRVIRVRETGNWATDAVTAVLDDERDFDSIVVLEAGELAPRDRLRKLCEDHGAAACIACYVDDEQSLDQLITASLRAHGLTIERGAKALLIASLGADRGVTRQELEKLAVYKARGDGEITRHDVQACVGDGAAMARDDVALAALSGDQVGLDSALTRCWQAGETPVGILRGVARHVQRLHLLSGQRGDLDAAMKRLRPPVYFKHVPIVRGQLQQWSPRALAQAMTIVTEAEVDCKTTGMPGRAVCGRALIRIAHAARAGGAK